MLIGMCMDHRYQLRIPGRFAYIMRTGGANLEYLDFWISYAIGVGCLSHLTLIGHTECGMVRVKERREAFIEGLVKCAGWNQSEAAAHFDAGAKIYDIGDSIDYVVAETRRLSKRYPWVKVTPLIYKVEDNRLYPVEASAAEK